MRVFAGSPFQLCCWLALSSGPSAYVFDETGRLVDWTSDMGDDPVFANPWFSPGTRDKRRPLSRHEISTQ